MKKITLSAIIIFMVITKNNAQSAATSQLSEQIAQTVQLTAQVAATTKNIVETTKVVEETKNVSKTLTQISEYYKKINGKLSEINSVKETVELYTRIMNSTYSEAKRVKSYKNLTSQQATFFVLTQMNILKAATSQLQMYRQIMSEDLQMNDAERLTAINNINRKMYDYLGCSSYNAKKALAVHIKNEQNIENEDFLKKVKSKGI